MRISAAIALVCLTSGVAFAEPTPAERRADASPEDAVGWHYLYDGGAIPFLWLPMAGAITIRLFVEPPTTPRLFSASEGGEQFRGDTVSEAAVALYAFGGVTALALLPMRKWERLDHLKGLAETLMTNALLTEGAKVTFGRHRPQWTPAMANDPDARSSFFSGHSSFMFATSTYLGLYLHGHVFARWRDPGQSFAAWELLPYSVLAGGSIAVAASRVHDNRHHPSDVITGAAVGTGLATAFYLYQESRYRRSPLRLVPSEHTLSIAGSW